MGLLELFSEGKKYLKDAMPGGLLNQEWTPENVRTAAEVTSMIPNPVGDVASGLLAADDLRKGNYGDAALNGLGLLPFVPALAGAVRDPGKWQFLRKEWRNTTGLKESPTDGYYEGLISDWSRPEVSAGSGRDIVNVYWLKHGETGEVAPFGIQTAKEAMGIKSQKRLDQVMQEASAAEKASKDFLDRVSRGVSSNEADARKAFFQRGYQPGSDFVNSTLLENNGQFYRVANDLLSRYQDALGSSGWKKYQP